MVMILANMKLGIDQVDEDEEARREIERGNKKSEEERKVRGIVKEMLTDREEEEEDEGEVEIEGEEVKDRILEEAEVNSQVGLKHGKREQGQ